MTLWVLLAIVFVAGAVGGVINAWMSDNGFMLPRTEESGGNRLIRPGFLGNIITGGISASVSWGLYGPFAAAYIVGGPAPGAEGAALGLSLASLVGAVLVGVGGARWLTNEVDKKLLRAAGTALASSPANPELAAKIGSASPAAVLQMACGTRK
ncbi:MAG: hypothetical protein A2Y78_05035 [Acidobacteria bacterium RBG_13_68_16]|nr:MAG: hypothetical protein A2Y78_05035 [Acidobacteria bacterium RBG_13_68_16]